MTSCRVAVRPFVAAALSASAIACSASRGGSEFGDASTSSTASSGSGGASASSSASTTGAGGLGLGGGPTGASSSASTGGGSTGPAEVFAHSDTQLYKLDPNTKAITVVGDFKGCTSVIDIAIDKNGKMVGTTFGGLYWINKSNAVCTPIATGAYPNSLSFVPQGTLDPNDEALVGYVDATYVRIDEGTGVITNVGSLGPNAGDLVSSGDVVSVIGGGTYLTVNGTGCNDCIVEIDPKTGEMKKNIGQLQFSGVWGLAFWAGTAYGFDDNGDLFSIDLTNGACAPIQGIGTASFWGAGSTTAAPVGPPK